MTAVGGEPVAFADSHVHFWKFHEHPWYPLLQEGGDESGLGDLSALRRDYLPAQYLRDAADFAVRAIIHVNATTAPGTHRAEVPWLHEQAAETGWPTALIGSFDPGQSATEIERDLETQAEGHLFRGVRLVAGLEPGDPKLLDVYRICADHGWLFEVVSHPEQADEHAATLERVPAGRFVLEHTGWPTSTDAGHFRLWRDGLTRLAALENLTVKISGLPMTIQSVAIADLRPWVEAAIESFGPRRSMFGSNFPVDGMYGSFADLIGSYHQIAAELGDAAVQDLFMDTAVRTYGIEVSAEDPASK
jgi:predicted TIM-barrel fold metal-dependent hydrolase